jgi:hypothetical protein
VLQLRLAALAVGVAEGELMRDERCDFCLKIGLRKEGPLLQHCNYSWQAMCSNLFRAFPEFSN